MRPKCREKAKKIHLLSRHTKNYEKNAIPVHAHKKIEKDILNFVLKKKKCDFYFPKISLIVFSDENRLKRTIPMILLYVIKFFPVLAVTFSVCVGFY